jgi:hypothetical protein
MQELRLLPDDLALRGVGFSGVGGDDALQVRD